MPYDSDDVQVLDGFSQIQIHPSGRDVLGTALTRKDPLQPYTEDLLICEILDCGQAGTTTTHRLEAAPHYLRVHVKVGTLVGNVIGTSKNHTPIGIPPIIDLTAHMYAPNARRARPLRYKLISALYYIGPQTTGGHWVAGVSRPLTEGEISSLKRALGTGERAAKASAKQAERTEKSKNAEPAVSRKRKRAFPSTQYHLCNDSRIADFRETDDFNPLIRNPMTLAVASVYGANTVMLIYERLPHRTPRYLSELETALDQYGYYAIGSGAPKEEKIEKNGEIEKGKKEEGTEKERTEREGTEKSGGDGSSGKTKDIEKKVTDGTDTGNAEGEKKEEEEKPEG
ncbi:hypothetical protein G6514_010146 [Epicoccum nigrum]|nr:hypothetical protein G6514_010146 [Epicoccum nigrum]